MMISALLVGYFGSYEGGGRENLLILWGIKWEGLNDPYISCYMTVNNIFPSYIHR